MAIGAANKFLKVLQHIYFKFNVLFKFRDEFFDFVCIHGQQLHLKRLANYWLTPVLQDAHSIRVLSDPSDSRSAERVVRLRRFYFNYYGAVRCYCDGYPGWFRHNATSFHQLLGLERATVPASFAFAINPDPITN